MKTIATPHSKWLSVLLTSQTTPLKSHSPIQERLIRLGRTRNSLKSFSKKHSKKLVFKEQTPKRP